MADDKQGTAVESKVGMFEFGPAPEASRDEAAQTAADPSLKEDNNLSNANQSQDQGQQQEPENQEQVEGQEQGHEETVTEEPFEVDGRTFATKEELVTAYRNSSKEGLRLSNWEKEYLARETELKAKMTELEDKLSEQPFPGLLSTDEEQEAAQLELMPTHKQTEYILRKQEWEKQQAAAKEGRVQTRKQMEEQGKKAKELMAAAETEMSQQKDKYPEFEALKPTRDKIVELTPCIANRPETPYLSYWIAYGLNAYGKDEAARKKAAETGANAKLKAQSAQQQIGKGGTGKPAGAPTNGTGSSIVAAYRDRNKVDL